MAQRSHVPKFGNWEGDNVPYTAYFDNARKEKGGVGKIMNPNDPEENPEAFMLAEGLANGNDSLSNSGPASSESSLDKGRTSSEKYRSRQRITSDQTKTVSQKKRASESSSDKNNSDNSIPRQPNHQRKKSDRKKSTSENSNGFFSASSAPNWIKGSRNPSDDLSSRSASIPKFGAWDERDPKSGEGFTVIFNKVKEEKQIAASQFPPVQPQASTNPTSQKTRSKIFCCLFESASD